MTVRRRLTTEIRMAIHDLLGPLDCGPLRHRFGWTRFDVVHLESHRIHASCCIRCGAFLPPIYAPPKES